MSIQLPRKIFQDHGLEKYLNDIPLKNQSIQIKNNNIFNLNYGTVDTNSTIGKIIGIFHLCCLSFECALFYWAIDKNIETAKNNIDWAETKMHSKEVDTDNIDLYKKVIQLYNEGEVHVQNNNVVYKRSFQAFIVSIAAVATGALIGSGVLTTLGAVSAVAASVFGGYYFVSHCGDYSNTTKKIQEACLSNYSNISLVA